MPNINHPQHKRQCEDNTPLTQRQTILQYLAIHDATASMLAYETGIPQKCITRYKRDLEKEGRLWEIEKKPCEKTGFKAWYLTTNPKKKQNKSLAQLNIF